MRKKPNLRWVEKVTELMDSKYRLPGTNFRFGLDPILGLIPFLGDAVSFGISSALLLSMWKHGASGEVKARMSVNIILDLLIGSIPVIGSIFDFYFKGNERNLRLLKRHYESGAYPGSGKGVIWLAALILILVLALAAWGLIALLKWIF